MHTVKILLAIAVTLLLSASVTAADLNQVTQLHSGFSSHRVSYSIKMSKAITLGLQEITGTAELYVGNSPQNLQKVAEIGYNYDLALGVSVGQEIGITQQLFYDQVPPQWYVLITTSGNADFDLVWQMEQPYTP